MKIEGQGCSRQKLSLLLSWYRINSTVSDGVDVEALQSRAISFTVSKERNPQQLKVTNPIEDDLSKIFAVIFLIAAGS